MKAYKSVTQVYERSAEIHQLAETFRLMLNECIRIGLEENKTSLKSLSVVCYPKLKDYRINSYFKLSAISRASGILKNHRKLSRKHEVKRPCCTRPVLTTGYRVSVRDVVLKLPGKIAIPLNPHTLQVLSQEGLEVCSVTLGATKLSVSVRKEAEMLECTGMLGIDRNLENLTLADSEGNLIRYDLRRATETRAKCRQTKKRFVRSDIRIRRLIFSKYGALERNRTQWILHNISSSVVNHAKENKLAIAMEDINGIRKLYGRGNGQNREYRFKMNSWSYYEMQRQIVYKANWEGIPVYHVNPRGTSGKCSKCGDRMIPEESRNLSCSSCGLRVDRDVNAARNVLRAGLRFGPKGPASEAMVRERVSKGTPIPKVDASQLAPQHLRS